MKLRDPRLLLTIASLALVGVLVTLDLERRTPGPLSPAHAAVAELAGEEGCALCHGDRTTSMATACGSCHAEVAEQLAGGHGLHGSLERATAERCARCHVEHHGAELDLAGTFAFARAGVPERDAFDHGHVRFELVGAHSDLQCAACHANADADWLREGERRFLGLDQSCSSCHEDPHEGRYSTSCATCHGQEHPFATVASFEHGEAFPLVGAHGRPGCVECHPTDGPHAIAALALGTGGAPSRTCAQCHDDPHRDDFVATVAAVAGLPVGDSCSLCHDAVHEAFDRGATLTAAQHALTAFPLDAPHAGLACEDCHGTPADGDFAERFPGRSREACAACHDDPHGGQFDPGSGSAFAGAACVDCHAVDAFHPHAFGLAQHRRTAFPLTGAHRAADCADCHAEPHADPLGTRFADADVACSACHADVHGGALALDGAAGCAECHATTTFADVDRVAFDHGRTGFELGGAHADLACEACHVPAAAPDEQGRTFGRVAASPAGHDACSGCHADAHAGRLREPSGPSAAALAHLVGDARGCARCHDTSTFRAVDRRVFDHGAWTGFALDGAHDAITCESCHGSGAVVADGGTDRERRLGFVHERFQGSFETCATCHADPHGGTFARVGPQLVDGRQGCERCHTTAGFDLGARERFDHALWTGFALDGAHAAVDCSACHTRPRRDDSGMRLGRAPGSDCASCHADPHAGQFVADGRTDCARCHDSTEAFAHLRFDHDRDTRFPLDARHAQLDCADCHQPYPLPDGSEVVRYRPLGTSCVDCHGVGWEERR